MLDRELTRKRHKHGTSHKVGRTRRTKKDAERRNSSSRTLCFKKDCSSPHITPLAKNISTPCSVQPMGYSPAAHSNIICCELGANNYATTTIGATSSFNAIVLQLEEDLA